MRTVSISVDVWCDYAEDSPAYRVFVDSCLLTERTFIWNTQSQFVREHIEVNLTPGAHWVTISNLSKVATFRIENLQVDGIIVASEASSTNAKFLI